MRLFKPAFTHKAKKQYGSNRSNLYLHKNTTFHNYHQVKFAMVLVAGRDVINWEVPSRSREVKYVHWNLKISFLKLWNLSWNLKMACRSCAFLWNTMIFIAIEKFCCPPCTAGRCIYPSCSEPSSLAPFSIVLWKSKKKTKRESLSKSKCTTWDTTIRKFDFDEFYTLYWW